MGAEREEQPDAPCGSKVHWRSPGPETRANFAGKFLHTLKAKTAEHIEEVGRFSLRRLKTKNEKMVDRTDVFARPSVKTENDFRLPFLFFLPSSLKRSMRFLINTRPTQDQDASVFVRVKCPWFQASRAEPRIIGRPCTRRKT